MIESLTARDMWLKLCNTYEGSSEIESLRRETYNMQYHTFLRNLETLWMTALLGLSSLSIIYVLMVLLHTLIINMLSSYYMHLMIMYET
jgi:hypothetical protein